MARLLIYLNLQAGLVKNVFAQDVSKPFERIMGCTQGELVALLDKALPGAQLETSVTMDRGVCCANFSDGCLYLEWVTLPDHRIALLEIPQMKVRFRYEGLPLDRRLEIQDYFDRATQRGGG